MGIEYTKRLFGEGVNKTPLYSTEENHHSHKDQLMTVDLQYPLPPYERNPYTNAIQLGIIDGLQAFASVCHPRILKKYAVDVNLRNAHIQFYNPEYAKVQELLRPDKISEFNLDTEMGHEFLSLEARLFFDKLDPVYPVSTALYAKALAEKLRCDIARNEGIKKSLSLMHHTPSAPEDAVEVLPADESKTVMLHPEELLNLPVFTSDHVGEAARDGKTFLAATNTFQYIIDNHPERAITILDTYADTSLSLTYNKFAEMLGRQQISIGYPVSASRLAELVNDTDENGKTLFHGIDDKLSTYTAVIFTEQPALYPYIHKYMYSSYAPEQLCLQNVRSYLDYTLYDSNTQYDALPLASRFTEKNYSQWEAFDHEYVPNNFLGARANLALDYLYRRSAFGGHPTYMGVNNTNLCGEDTIKTAMDLAVRYIDRELRHQKLSGVDLGVVPQDSAYPTVALEETAKQFHIHDPATLAVVTNLPLSTEDKRMYLYLTQPAISKIVDAKLHIDGEKTKALYGSIFGKLPDLLYEMQKAMLFMPEKAQERIRNTLYDIPLKQTYNRSQEILM